MKRFRGAGIFAAFLAVNLYSAPSSQQAPPPGSVAATVPAEVVYAIFFKELVAFQKQAEELERQGKSGLSVRSHQQEVTELSDRQFAKVRAVAASCIQDIETYGRQAASIMEGIRNSVKAAGTAGRVPPLPQELIDLEQKRNTRVLAAVEEIRTALGPGAFLYFDMLVRGHLAAHPCLPPVAVPSAPGSAAAPK